MISNLFSDLPRELPEELFTTLVATKNLRIERILSHGHSSPPSGWYDQAEHEWVLLLQGEARLAFCNRDDVHLKPGDFVNIPAHCKHKVTWTQPDAVSVWLAVFYTDATETES